MQMPNTLNDSSKSHDEQYANTICFPNIDTINTATAIFASHKYDYIYSIYKKQIYKSLCLNWRCVTGLACEVSGEWSDLVYNYWSVFTLRATAADLSSHMLTVGLCFWLFWGNRNISDAAIRSKRVFQWRLWFHWSIKWLIMCVNHIIMFMWY